MRVTSALRALAAVFVGLCILPGRAHAYPMYTNARIDRTLRVESWPRVVIAGRITAHLVDVLGRQRPGIVPGLQHIVFEVTHVLLGEGYAVGDHVRFSTRDFEWPELLVPLEISAGAYLIVDPSDKADRIAPFLEHDGRVKSVVPWSGDSPRPVANRRDVERLLASELAAAISMETSAFRLRALVRQATPVLSAEQAEAVLAPLMKSEDEWLHHAAIAGLAYAFPTLPHLDQAVEGLRVFIRRTPANAKFVEEVPSKLGTTITYNIDAYDMLFGCYWILQSDWSDAEVQRLRPLLPLLRVVAMDLGKERFHHWHRGIHPLCVIGDAEDLPVLYDYYTSHETRPSHAPPEAPEVRVAVLRRLAELLDVELVARSDGTKIEREDEQGASLAEAYSKHTAAARGED